MEEGAGDGEFLFGASSQKRNALSRLLRKLKHTAASPTFLTLAGLLLVAVGAALIATPVALGGSCCGGSSYVAPVPAPPAVDSEGVPLDAAAAPPPGDDGRLDCRVGLSNLSAYLEAATSAEAALFGAPAPAALAANASTQGLRSQLDAQPSLLMGTVFWVLVSAGPGGRYNWSDVLPDAVAVQLDWANSALVQAGAGLALRLDALVAVPAPDAAVEGCAYPGTWAALDGVLAPDARRLHFLVCEPAGVNGASAAVLGDAAWPAGAPRTALLRRSALLFSRGSMVHQLGHALGLAHPFPDHPTCKYDADGIPDTPAQFYPNTGCPSSGDDGLCNGADPNLAPASVNYMDLTNDTCRMHFTLGQAARMRAMLAAYRPQLAAAATSGRQATALRVSAAFQSAPPSEATLGVQVTSYVEAAGSGCSGSRTGGGSASGGNGGNGNSANGTNSSGADTSLTLNSLAGLQNVSAALVAARRRLGDPRQQAAAAASGRLSAALQSCSCAGPDSSGRVFWTGQLNGSFWVDAVQLLLPVNVSAAASGGSGASAAAAPPAPWAAPAPMPEPGLALGLDGPGPNSSSSSGGSSAQLIEVRIGDSADHSANTLCTQQLVALAAPLLRVACDRPAAGQFVTVAALPAAAGSNASRRRDLCLCAVQPLSFNGSAHEAPSTRLAAELALPAAAGVQAGRSSTGASAAGGAAAALAAGAPSLVPANCSATGAEASPRWWVSAGLDPLFIRGLRLSAPWPSSAADGSSTQQQASSISVYVTNALLPAGGSQPPAGSLCAAHVLLPPGQTVDVDCGRVLQGRVVTVEGSNGGGGGNSSLALCDVRLMGARELRLAGAASLAPGVQLVQPPALLPDFSLAMDGDDATCLDARASSTSASSGASGSGVSAAMWQLALARSSSVVGVRLSGGGGSGSVELLDAGGAVAWSAELHAGSSSSGSSSWDSGSGWLEPAAPVVAAGLRVRGFARLCEARLLVLP